MVHLALHLAVPAALAGIFYRQRWLYAFAIMMAGMLIDLDHLLASPIYDPGRCSVGFHPLHGPLPIMIYAAGLAFPKTRLPALGLIVHIVLDAIDCKITNNVWFV